MEINSAIQQTFGTTSASSAAAEDPNDTVISSDFETFLKMLTTQLENQDPLDPVKSEDFAVQLATFSGVEQQVLTNDLLESMISKLGLSGISDYASWVGMEARAAVPAQFDGTPLTVAPRPDLTAGNAQLVVQDENGNVVDRVAIPVAHKDVTWDGIPAGSAFQLPPGTYSFKVESYTDGIVSNTQPVEVFTEITEVRLDGGEAVLITEAGGEVRAADVSALRQGT